MTAAVTYRVRPSHPREHYYSVRCTLTSPDPQGQVFRLPSWLRGSYLVRDFAKHVLDLRAFGSDAIIHRQSAEQSDYY